MRTLRAFIRDESGTTSMEYALIGTIVSIVIVASVRSIGLSLNNKFIGPVAANLS